LKKTLIVGAFICALGLAIPALAANVDYPDFSSTNGLKLNGKAKKEGNVIRLVRDLSQDGTMFTKKKVVKTNKSFESEFTLSMHDAPVDPADGIAFVVQPKAASTRGHGGGGLGYSGIKKSLDVEFDVFYNVEAGDPDANHVAIMKNGQTGNHLDVATSSFPMYGTPFYGWVDYDAQAKEVSVYTSQATVKPPNPIVQTSFDLANVTGAAKARAGFTAGTGASAVEADIVSWTLK
jgi:hypothetical protein